MQNSWFGLNRQNNLQAHETGGQPMNYRRTFSICELHFYALHHTSCEIFTSHFTTPSMRKHAMERVATGYAMCIFASQRTEHRPFRYCTGYNTVNIYRFMDMYFSCGGTPPLITGYTCLVESSVHCCCVFCHTFLSHISHIRCTTGVWFMCMSYFWLFHTCIVVRYCRNDRTWKKKKTEIFYTIVYFYITLHVSTQIPVKCSSIHVLCWGRLSVLCVRHTAKWWRLGVPCTNRCVNYWQCEVHYAVYI